MEKIGNPSNAINRFLTRVALKIRQTFTKRPSRTHVPHRLDVYDIQRATCGVSEKYISIATFALQIVLVSITSYWALICGRCGRFSKPWAGNLSGAHSCQRLLCLSLSNSAEFPIVLYLTGLLFLTLTAPYQHPPQNPSP